MNNTVITSISALIFLVIGLLVGKSNNQIEIQTVVKTNIVEKPVVEYVDKPYNKIEIEYKDLAIDGFPDNLKSIITAVIVDDKIKNLINKDEIETKIELELRRAGLKIEATAEKSDAQIRYVLSAVDLKNGSYVMSSKLEIWRYVVFTLTDKNYTKPAAIWSNIYLGLLDAKDLNKDIHTTLSKQMDELSNSILKSK